MPVFELFTFTPVVFAGLVLVWVALEDVQFLSIPNAAPLALVAAYALYALTAPSVTPATVGLSTLVALGLLAAGIVFFAFGWLGGGDGKLIAAVGLWAGPAYVAEFAVVTALVGGVMAFIAISPVATLLAEGARRLQATEVALTLSGRRLPYGIAIAVGGWVVLAHVATA